MHMTGSAGTGHLTGMLDIKTVFKRSLTDTLTFFRLNNCTLWANFMMR
jgi:hypothetical protein